MIHTSYAPSPKKNFIITFSYFPNFSHFISPNTPYITNQPVFKSPKYMPLPIHTHTPYTSLSKFIFFYKSFSHTPPHHIHHDIHHDIDQNPHQDPHNAPSPSHLNHPHKINSTTLRPLKMPHTPRPLTLYLY